MCGRVYVKSTVEELLANFAFVRRHEHDRAEQLMPRFNGAPGLDYPIIVREPEYPGGMFMRARWGLIPAWTKDVNPGVRPINATAERVSTAPMFRAAYASRRGLLPIHGFFEWRAIKGTKRRQPYAIAMKDGSPFALAVIWEEWRHPRTGDEHRTFAVITCPANDLVGRIHTRMPVIIAPEDYQRWIGDEHDPRDLLKAFPSDLMSVWPVNARVNSPANDDEGLIDPVPEEPDEPDLFGEL